MTREPSQEEKPPPIDPAEIKKLRPEQLDLLEAELERQEASMTTRGQAASTRANILLGASAVLGGAELVTASGLPWLTTTSLILYLGAALAGLLAARSRMGSQPSLGWAVHDFVNYSAISLRRDLFMSRMRAQQKSVLVLNQRHRWLVSGVVVLALAWASSASGSIWAAAHPEPETPLIIQIDEENGAQDG